MLNKIGANHFAVVGDVSDASVCSLLIEQVVHHFGTSDILVNNAGIIRRAPAMLARGSGKVINIASVLIFLGEVLVPSYLPAKGGVWQLTKGIRQ